jgi:hypothetical protein
LSELVASVNVALGTEPLAGCRSADANGDEVVTIDELVEAVGRALQGCP